MTTRSLHNNSNGNKFKLFIFVIISSTYFWKLFMCTIFTTILIRQYTNTYNNIHIIIHNTDNAGYSSLQQQSSSPLLSSSSSSIIDDDVNNNNNVNVKEKVALATEDADTDDDNDEHNKPVLPPLLSNLNLNLGSRWKKSVQSKLKEQEKVRSRGIKNQDEKIDIKSNFKRLQNRLHDINTTVEIDNPHSWHTVTSKSYEQIRLKAHQSIKNDLRVSNKVHTDCILWLVPPSTTASSSSSSLSTDQQQNTIIRAFQDENDGKDRDNYNKRKDQTRRRKSNVGPQIKFQCDLLKNNTSEVLVLQDEPCSSSANLCRVETNILVWNDYYETIMNMNMNMSNNTNSNSSSSSSTYFNYTKIKESIIMMPPPPSSINSLSSSSSSKSRNKSKSSTLLTMVDTIQYLKYGHQYIWECFLNKASYSLRTQQTFYIWIGTLELKSKSESKSSVVVEENSSFTTNTTEELSKSTSTLNSNSNNILHQRNTDTIYKNFGTKCNPESMTTNTINYYKPIAFITLFQKLLSLDYNNNKNNKNEEQEQEEQRVWFVDADIFFNEEAYPTTTPNNNNNNNPNTTTTTDDYSDSDSDLSLPLLQSLDDYFDLSTTAILFGAQNPSGKSENIVLNGGLLGLRLHKHAHNATASSSSRSSNLNEVLENENENEMKEWNVFDFASLWWYCRCGERDQIALWLVLFATWSAESSHSSSTSSASSSSLSSSASSLSSSAHTTTTSTNNSNNNSVVSSIQQEQLAFSYPGVIFENYLFSWYGVIPHIHQYLQQKLNHNNSNSNKRVQPMQQQQQNVQQQHQVVNNQFNGGLEFLNSKYGNAIFTYPLELPHLLVLPLDPFQVRSSTITTTPTPPTSTLTSSMSSSTSQPPPPPFQEEKKKSNSRTNFNLGIIKKNQSDKKALLSHNKNMYNTCYNYKCYPYYL